MAKAFSASAELKTLRTICEGKERVSGQLLASLSKDSFFYEPAKEGFGLILKNVHAEGVIPPWSALCSDPSISEPHRRVLKACNERPLDKTDKAKSLSRTMERYRQMRGLASIAESIYNQLESDKTDPSELADDVGDKLLKVRSRVDVKSQMHHTGKGNNSSQIIKDILYGKKKRMVPTGFRGFDSKNGGFFEGSLVIVAANSGGGKSALANQLGVNFAIDAMEDVCIVPLEMTSNQMWCRTLGVLTGIEVNRIQQQNLTDAEQKLVTKAYKKFTKTLKKNGTRHTVFSPEEDMGIEELLFMLKPFNYKVIIIDYISLLKGADGDDQVKELGRIARFAKVFAKNTGSIVILLAQLSDEGQVKYARAIKEHANNLWSWYANDEEAEVSIYDIKQQKARNQLRFPFQLQSHNSSMRITDVDADSAPLGDPDDKKGRGKKSRHKDKHKDKRGKKSSSSNDDYMSDLNDEGSESDED